MAKDIAKKEGSPPALLTELAKQAGLDAQRYYNTIVKTILKKKDGTPSNEEVYAFLMTCKKYDFDPILKQIHGFVGRDGQIQPIIGIDGYVKVAINHKNYGGHATTTVLNDVETGATIKIIENQQTGATDIIIEPEGAKVNLDKAKLVYAVTAFYLKNLEKWVAGDVQWFSECYRDTTPWKQMPRRMLAHKAYSQAVRKIFGISGVYDADEARDIQINEAHPGAIDSRARAVVDVDPILDPPDDGLALPGPVGPGNVSDHRGHDGETGAAEAAADEVDKAATAPDDQASLPDASDDPESKVLSDDADVYKKWQRQIHAVKKEANWTTDELNGWFKPHYKVKSMKDLTVAQAREIVRHLQDNPKEKDEEPAAPAEAPPDKGGAEKANWAKSLLEYHKMFPNDWVAVLEATFPDKDFKDKEPDGMIVMLSIAECEKFLGALEEKL